MINSEDREFEDPAGHPLAVLVVIDALRADDLGSGALPGLDALAAEGVQYVACRTVTPAVTRAAAASLVTGCLPRRTGVVGNSIWTPETVVDTGSAGQLLDLRSRHGRVVDVPTLGEILAADGKRVMVVGTGSPGCAYLLHPEVESVGGAVVMAAPELQVGPVLPATLRSVLDRHHGLPPVEGSDSMDVLAWGVQAASGALFDQVDPDVLVLWCGEPDEIRHAAGVDAAKSVFSRIDAELCRLLETLHSKGRPLQTVVTSDHGMVDLQPGAVLGPELFAHLPRHLASMVTICNSGAAFALHIPKDDGSPALREELAAWCREQPWAGEVFINGNHSLTGVRPMTDAGCDHPVLGPDVLVLADPAALPRNSSGARVATHGTFLPADVGIPLVLHGSHFTRAQVIDRPTALVDILPTILRVLGVRIPDGLDGTPLIEAFAGLLIERNPS